jgi:hypothetical protein
MRSSGFFVAALVASSGCALGRVRHVDVHALGPYADVQHARVSVEGPPEVAQTLETMVSHALASEGHLDPAEEGEAAYTVSLHVTADPGDSPPSTLAAHLSGAVSALGLPGLTPGAGQLEVEALLYAPSGEALGEVDWRGAGSPEELAPAAGKETGATLAETMNAKREDFSTRRAGDERLLLVETPLTLAPGEVVVQDDELLLTRAAVGLSRRLELDVWAGGAPVPVVGGAVGIFPHDVQASGGAGLLFAGMFDLGLKVKLVEEGSVVPGVALSYDLLDLFGDAVGAAGGIALGQGITARGGVAGGLANLQFNVFGLSAGKHFGATQLIAGGYLVDNHHFLPQSAVFATGGASLQQTSQGTGGSASGSAGAADLTMMPAQVMPFVAVEHVLGPHSALMAELLPRAPWWDSVATTGIRWRFGFSRPWGPLAMDRVRLTLDLACVWAVYPTSSTGGVLAPLPYASAGLYFL